MENKSQLIRLTLKSEISRQSLFSLRYNFNDFQDYQKNMLLKTSF